MPEQDTETGGYVAGLDTVVSAEKQPEPLAEFSAWVKEDMRRYMRLMAKMVRYSDHLRQETEDGVSSLSASRFMQLLNLAAMDVFYHDSPDQEKLVHLGMAKSEAREQPDFLERLRAHPAYLGIRDDLDQKMVALRDGNVGQMAEFFGGVAALETAQTMLFGKKDRDRNDAGKAFMDRAAPMKSRGDGVGLVVIIPDNYQDMLRGTMEILEAHGHRRDPLISAKRVRTPALPPAQE